MGKIWFHLAIQAIWLTTAFAQFRPLIRGNTNHVTVDGFLSADSLGGLGIRQQDLQLCTIRLVESLLNTDCKQAARVFHQGIKLLRVEEQDKGGFYRKSSNNLSHHMQWLIAIRKRHVTLNSLGFLLELYRDDPNSEIAFDGLIDPEMRLILRQAFLANGGNYRPELAMQRLADQLQEIAGDGEMRYLSPGFMFVFPYLSANQRRQMQRWADSVGDDSRHHSLSRAVRLAIGLYQKETGQVVDADNPIVWQWTEAAVADCLQDASLSPLWRAGFAATLGFYEHDWGEVIAISVGESISQCFARQAVLSHQAFQYAMPLFFSGDVASDQWQRTGKELWENWQTVLSSTASRRGIFKYYFTVPMLDLNCRLLQVGAIEGKLSGIEEAHLSSPSIVVILIRHGYYDLARDILLNECDRLERNPQKFFGEYSYDRRLAEQVPAFLDTIANQEDRNFAKLYLAGVPNPSGPFADRAQDIGSLADRISQSFDLIEPVFDVSNTKRMARVMELLTLGWGNEEISKFLENHQVGLSQALIDRERLLRARWASQVEMFEARNELNRGNTFPWLFNWGRVIFENNSGWQRYRNDMAFGMVTSVTEQMIYHRNSPQHRESLLYVARRMLETVPQAVSQYKLHSLFMDSLLVHAFAGRIDEFDQWWDTLEPNQQRSFTLMLSERMGLVSRFWTVLNPLDLPPEKLFADTSRRQAFSRDIYTTDYLDAGYKRLPVLAYAHYKNLLNEQDVFDIAGQIARDAPRGGAAYREWLVSLADQDKFDACLDAVEFIIDTEKGLSEERYRVGLLEKIMLLEAVGREAEAADLLLSIYGGDKRFGSVAPKEYPADLLERLSKRLLPNHAP